MEPTSSAVLGAGEGAVQETPQAEVKEFQVSLEVDDTQKEVQNEISTDNIADAPKAENTEETYGGASLHSDAEVGKTEGKCELSEPVCNNTSDDWQQREAELLKKIEELEKVKTETVSDHGVRTEECELLRARIRSLETELAAALSRPGVSSKEIVDSIKQQHEDLLTKARGMIFDKTKIVKNQELQIAALTSQVSSLKDVNTITKDLLEIRNAEIKSLEERLEAMEARIKAERQRHSLVLQRAETSTNINVDLRKEYETQLALFKELRVKYDERVQALVAENNRLKDSLKGGPSG